VRPTAANRVGLICCTLPKLAVTEDF